MTGEHITYRTPVTLCGRSLPFFLPLVFLLIGPPCVSAFEGDLDSAGARFHRAEAAFVQRNVDVALKEYAAAFAASKTLDLELREWYEGNAAMGLACCYAKRRDTLNARGWLDYAVSHRYWVFGAVQGNDELVSVVGRNFADSLCSLWSRVRDERRPHWSMLRPIIIRPTHCDTTRLLPTIIAFHGGNGYPREFGLEWQSVADSLCMNIVVPPGVARLSLVGFAWESEMRPIDSAYRALFRDPEVRGIIDPERTYLAGFSQGGHAALGLAIDHPDIVRGAVIIEGFYASPVDSATLARLRENDVRFYGIYGQWGYPPFNESFTNFQRVCDSAHVRSTMEIVPDMVHELPRDLATRMKRAIDWIEEQHTAQRVNHASYRRHASRAAHGH